ncbi:hypothetical protein B0I72DRAFT_142831 [Yarrowia lipolytica]|jgi:nucleoporin NUP60|uniref:YALI0C22253p n=3 Tax=Yarrowia lipolytica TaxID=4952 RepID=Q6CB34_YARLI|nr:YALI0C22253p [Yarrowia lipolytica CLIB122]KAB8280849.1 hypothetical protein BKA91DRAFT_141269 [Yarrowia lipolytica]KAE8172953.1 hypothetical protein BKA90DRAFT_136318 [Yarrowia lipolytica]KAJ8053738.1 hypothetical protein LXG23DRAFT_37878 [Yarrowia lipolytica]QNP95980.1 Hypothetical protein YALI2_B00285g [Yarrowia lipolytica]RDW27100.1 hypothetical protein B0I71DRAFT_129662 [Yarrowia lipolytica]|eukprot:XP_502128.1 YALI0C22253p [Yarrowia lipolytica CLIB122]
MENSRVVRTKSSLRSLRGSPYDRPQPRPSAPAPPAEGHRSGLFSRVVGFFRPHKPDDPNQPTQSHSPANLARDPPVSALYPVIDRSRTFEEPQMEEEITETVYTPSQTPPRHKRISLGPGKSPNQRLAEFFERKGDAPLSDVETAGVLALINEAASDDPNLAERLSPTGTQHDRSVRHSMSLANLAGRNETYGSPSKIPRRMEPAASVNGTLKKSRSMASIGQRNSRVTRSSLGGVRGRPSPMMSSPKRSARQALSPNRVTTTNSTSPITSPVSSVADRPLSGVASTLLSLIDDDEEEVVTPAESSPAKEFINPYASSPRRPERERSASQLTPPSREKLMTPSPEKKEASPSKTPSQIISQSMPLEQQRERDSVKAQPQMKKFDKYKPVRSSNLRDSFVADPKSPESTKTSAPKQTAVSSSGSPESMPPSFTFGNKTNNGFTSKLKSSSPSGDEDTDVKIGKDLASSAAIRSPSKPLYPEISKDKPVLPSTPKLAKAGIPSTPLSEAAKKYGRDFDFSTPLKGEVPKPLTPADKSKVDQFKKDFVF